MAPPNFNKLFDLLFEMSHCEGSESHGRRPGPSSLRFEYKRSSRCLRLDIWQSRGDVLLVFRHGRVVIDYPPIPRATAFRTDEHAQEAPFLIADYFLCFCLLSVLLFSCDPAPFRGLAIHPPPRLATTITTPRIYCAEQNIHHHLPITQGNIFSSESGTRIHYVGLESSISHFTLELCTESSSWSSPIAPISNERCWRDRGCPRRS
jgi:hypothetical protein